jgi:exonuclease VII small subunit
MLRREQDRIGAELRIIESRQVALDASLDDWQEVMDLTVRFPTHRAWASWPIAL